MDKKVKYWIKGSLALLGGITTVGAASGLYYDSWRYAAIGALISMTFVLFVVALVNLGLADVE